MSKLVVLGSVNADHVLQVPSFPRPGETLHGRNYQVIPGGKGANQAVAAARLNADIGFIACVGDDAFGLNIRESFQRDGIDIRGVKVQPDCPTGIAMIQVSDDGENTICLSAEANARLSSEAIQSELDQIRTANYLLMQLETPLDGVESAAVAAKESKTCVVLNPAPACPLPDSLLRCVDVITPNETEAEVLTGIKVTDEESAQQASNALHEKGIETVLITLGAKGVWLSQNGVGKGISSYRVEAVDTTAAGDTFNGALVTGLLESKPLESAIQFANAAAALSVTRFGAQTSIPTRKEVDDFLAKQLNT
ncbi:ribokinase [Vibrio nigripulchritudo SFn27]|uniref:Ribokinase n=1 Tax=Vibrio nigripulchritudo TaxID=28173 RepID=U4KG08_9VIBR|nr:ribokinase [Vibrio nigripulchritudo]CCN84611.1 ribokinase [Vibrio nigripulchritudo BLFn1]CCN90894.1 ribokinase [Vibrio nigripulchritudo SFn27]CCN96173.1 ribokinase [Vibrio nigripulchritudo ENn2]CCO41217.1 ribokinase [Vibrio nigripulchritudo SFn135]CCO54554.1 ribokinase [Vibrio nigripulchritudo Wn13]